MAEREQVLTAARAAFARKDWPGARDGLLAARADGALSAADTFTLGDAVFWLGAFREAERCYEDAHRLALAEGQPRAAARAALATGGLLLMRGEPAAGGGWMLRAVRLLESEPECAEHGYLLIGELEGALAAGDFERAAGVARQMQTIGRRTDDASLAALGMAGEGRALIRQGQVAGGLALMDAAMVAALGDGLDPAWAGNIYCQIMRVCYELSDMARAGEWTRATARWCESLPAAGPFMGVCRVHRAQVLQTHGAWEQAEQEAARVCRELADFDSGTTGEAQYQLGEIHRLRGDLEAAEQAYRQAHALGREPQPGLALLRLAQGRVAAAATAIDAALTALAHDRLARGRLCAAQVEIALEAGDLPAAERACAELEETAVAYQSSGLAAAAPQARGAVLLAAGRPAEALAVLREATLRWQQLNAPFEVARVRLLLARVHGAVGNGDAAGLELDAAEAVFRRLGAAAAMRQVAALRAPAALPDGLTEREAEVIALLAAGRSNREIAGALVISEKTVARHLSNIFTKLDLPSRTAVAAYAHRHGLARGPRG